MSWDTIIVHQETGLEIGLLSRLYNDDKKRIGITLLLDDQTIGMIMERDTRLLDTLAAALKATEEIKAIFYIIELPADYNGILRMVELHGQELVYNLNMTIHSYLADSVALEKAERILELIKDPIMLYELAQRERSRKKAPKMGYVYLLKSGPHYKIGSSSQIKNRLTKLATQPPFDIVLLHTIKSQDMFSLEKRLHEMFVDKRKGGEWFELSPEDVEYIRSL